MRRALRSTNIILLSILMALSGTAIGSEPDSIFDPDGASTPASTPKVPGSSQPPPPAKGKGTPAPSVNPPAQRIPTEKPVAPEPTVPRARLPVPPDAELTQTQSTIREAYKKEYAARDRAAADALVKKLMLEADKSADAVRRFALLGEVRDLAAKNGDLSSALFAVSRIAQSYRVGREKMSLETLDLAYKTGVVNMGEITEVYLLLADEFANIDDFDSALKAATKATASGGRSKIPALLTRAKLQTRSFSELKRQRDLADAAQTTLLLKPDDADANLVLGRYLCSAKDQWKEGLKRIAKCSDVESKKLAEADLAEPDSPDEMFNLAVRWWGFGQKKTDALPAFDARKRAAHWYCSATPALKGLAKSAAQARLSESFASTEFANVDVAKYVPATDDGVAPVLYGMSDPTISDDIVARPELRRIHLFGSRELSNAPAADLPTGRQGAAVLIQKMRWGAGDLTVSPSAGGVGAKYEAILLNQANQLQVQTIDIGEGAASRWSVMEDKDEVRVLITRGEKTLASFSIAAKEFKAFGFAASCGRPKEKADLLITLSEAPK